MPKRIIGLIVACLLALGGATLAVPAAAAPQTSTSAKAKTAKASAQAAAKAAAKAKAKAAKVQAAKAKAAKAKAAAAEKARWKYVVEAGPRAQAAAKAAAAARVRVGTTAKEAAAARARAAAAARTAAAAQAKAVAVAKSKASAKAKKKAVSAAKAAARASAKAAAKARSKAAAAVKARVDAAAKAKAAARARVDYAAQAGPRAILAARAAAAAKVAAAKATTKAAQARTRATLAARAAAAAQAKAVALAKTTASAKAKKKAAKAARKAARTSAKAAAEAQQSVAMLMKSKALVKSTKAAAKQAKKAAGPNPEWTPTDKLTFNNPRGSRKSKLAIITELNNAIDATPAGGEIRMAMYLFDINSVSKKLLAATKRGVSVQILIDDGESNRYIRKVRKAYGKNKKAANFVATCKRSCMSNGASVIHAKFYLFSVAGKGRYVSMISSANPYTGNTFKSWNNNHTIVGDEKIYDSLSKYFTDMLADKKNLNYYRVTSSGKYTIYLYPQAAKRPEDIVLLNVLNHTSCAPTAPGYGSDGRTLIRVSNWGWTGGRLDIAKRLWKLHDSGCKVQVMVNKGRTSRSVLKVLLKRSKTHGQMKVYNAWYDRNHNDVANLYTHHKAMTINGLLAGKNVKTTWTGSANFTLPATLANNEVILRVVDPEVTDAYNANFAYIRKHYTNRMYSVPYVTRIARN